MKQEKKILTRKVIGVVVAIAVILAGLVVFFLTQGKEDFDAGKYVTIILDYTFKGSTKDSEEMFDAEAMTQLENQYQTQIVTFVEKSITGNVEMEKEMKDKYIAVCKDVFKSMKYSVKSVKKISDDEFQVTVEYQAADIFQRYVAATKEEKLRLEEKSGKGEYPPSTQEEIEAQMQQEILNNCYELLKTAQKEVQYAEKTEMVFAVKRADDEKFAMDSAQLSDFLEKIMGLGENQD